MSDDVGATSSHQAEVSILKEPLPLRSVRVVSGLDLPIFATAPAGDPRLFVLEQKGQIRIVEYGLLRAQPFLDISDETLCCGERGLLGLAFPPDYSATGIFYVNFVAKDDERGTITLVRYQVSSGDKNVANQERCTGA